MNNSPALTLPVYRNLIAGQWRDGASRANNVNPWTGEVVGQSAIASPGDLEEATAAAVACAAILKARPTHGRVGILERAASILAQRKSEFVAAMNAELGRPASLNAIEVDRGVLTLRDAAGEAARLFGEYLPLDLMTAAEHRYGWWKRDPVGPVLAISPFNFPLNLLLHKVAPAISSGCPITIKAPPQTPHTPRLVAEVFEAAGVIPGELNLLDASPEVFEAAARDPRYKLLTFTGSPRAGWYLKSIAGKKRVLLELGNSSGAIVHHDARDMSWVVRRLVFGALAAAGQVCIHVQRIFVHERVWDGFCSEFVRLAGAAEPLPPEHPDAVLGPVIDDAAADRIEAWVREALAEGARALTPFRREGRRIWPCVLTNVHSEMKVCREEVFGPVVTLSPYADLGAAVREVNATPFGLQAGVFTDSLDVMHECIDGLEVAGVLINEYPMFRIDHMPYGGIKDSGLGREGVRFAIDEYTEKKLVVVNREPGMRP